MSYIDSGKEQGAKVHIGGNRFGKEGYFVEARSLFLLQFRVASGLIDPTI